MDPIEQVRSASLYGELPERELALIVARMEERFYPAGTLLWQQGDTPDKSLLLTDGEVSLFTTNEKMNMRFEVARHHAGECVGELDLVAGDPRTHSARVLRDVRALELKRERLLQLQQAAPSFSSALAGVLARRMESVSTGYGVVPYMSLSRVEWDAGLAGVIPRDIMERQQVIPVSLRDNRLTLAMLHPENQRAVDEVRRCVPGTQIAPVAVSQTEFDRFWRRYVAPPKRPGEKGPRDTPDARAQTVEYHEIKFFRSGSEDTPPGVETTLLLDEIIREGLAREASDIHIDPLATRIVVRFRVHGQLQAWDRMIPTSYLSPIVSRIKVLCGLDIAIRRRPQDGRFGITIEGQDFDMRVATMPTKDGERVTMRILSSERNLLPLDQIVLAFPVAAAWRKLMYRTSGMLLVTGPTGSGKTTTLYSMISELLRYADESNILTVEDPIEYRIEGITQVQIHEPSGLTFPDVLRSFLRHDPDIIMVGEMRDEITARIACQAALTGHLVLSSMHTTDSLGAYERLEEMGLERYLFANAMLGVLAQRLVQRVCPYCAVPYAYPATVLEDLAEMSVIQPGETPVLVAGKGCNQCRFTGFRGRVGLYEYLPHSDRFRLAVTSGQNRLALQALARAEGMVGFATYARFLLFDKLTVPAEVMLALPLEGKSGAAPMD